MDKKIRLGIIGIGNMGSGHACRVVDGECPDFVLAAVADINPARREWAEKRLGKDVRFFDTAEAMLDSGLIDACIVSTPHYAHPGLAIECMKRSIHVLVEKPAGVYTKQVRELIEVSKTTDKTYAIMFNQRTNCVFRKVKELIDSGKYGEIRRVSWIITDWYRTQSYYNSGGWRATWAGEGGGVMLNQCPHQLDLWQWLCGMPNKIKAICHEGKWHDIEVEDDVSIYAEYPNGATGTFITTTGDCPGTNRLEITLDGAKILVDDAAKITLYELAKPLSEHIYTAKGGFDRNTCTVKEVETDGKNEQHVGVMNAFAAHILHGTPLIAEGAEGINGLTISNAAFLSSWLDETVTLPIDEDLYYEKLQEKIQNSTYKKVVVEQVQEDMSGTF